MNKLRILILENDPDDAELIVQALRDARLSSVPKCIDSKADFKETLEEFKPSIILSDYRMPVFYCLAALMILKERSPKVPFIIISEEICREVTAEALSTASYEYALKDNLLSIGYAVCKVMDKFVKRKYRRIEGEGSAAGEKRFRELFGKYGSGIAFYKTVDDGRDFVLSDCNGALERITRLNREELIGKGVLDLFQSASDSGLFDDIHRVWKSGIPSHHPTTYYKDERNEGWREIYLYKVPSGDIAALYVDITSNRLLEEELQKSEERFSLIADSSFDAIFIIDREGMVRYISPAITRVTGYDPADLIGRPFTDYMPEEQKKKARETLKALFEGKIIEGFRQTVVRKDGEFVHVEINAAPIMKCSEIVGIQGAIRDITRRKAEEVELKKLSLAVQQSPVGILITDAEGNIEYVNPSFEAATGYSFDDVLGKNPRILKSGEHSIEFYKELWDTILQGNEWRGEFHNRKKNGDLYWESASISSIKNEDGRITHFLGVKEDITERKLLEQQLIHSQKMEAIGTLAGGIAHDFNNMLSVIIGYSDFLLMKLEKEDEMFKIIGEIKKSGQRASDVAQQLLAFSRKQVLKKSLINLNFVVTDMQKMLMRLIGEDISLETEFGENLHMIYADRVQVEQILMNLIINARDAMSLGGTVTIATENMLIDEQYCKEYPYARPGEYVCLSVADTGIGLEDSTATRVFDPFFTTKEFGTGLGLSVVYGIVKQHDGWINMSSEPGKGTKFNIFFPASVTSEEETIEVSVRVDKLAGRGERVLLVEDDRILREFTANVLRENGYTVLEARNSEEALEQFDKQNGKFDLIFSDVVLPDRSGVDLAEILSGLHKNLKVLLVSGYLDKRSKWEVIKQRGFHFIQKPYSLQNLLKGIQDAIHKTE
jgi:two-component system cell cycle sensor histidine kinase/response regulator CckA